MKFPARLSVTAAVVALLALIAVGAFLINAYIGQERQRDLLQWESRLGLVADGKADAIYRLLSASRRDLDELAGNASLRFYLWQATQARSAAREGGRSRNRAPSATCATCCWRPRSATATAGGSGARVPANVPQPRTAGLALLGRGPRAGGRDARAWSTSRRPIRRRRPAGARRSAAARTVELMLDAQDRP